jgi:uncharacterized membrane protein YphA (DoxX/SURF4 family)
MTVTATPAAVPWGSFLDRVVDRRGSLRAVALLRAVMGAVVIRHLWPEVRAALLPVDRFHVPWWSWVPVPSHTGYRLILWIGIAAGAAMILGVLTRLATITALAVVTYLLLVDMTGFAHNRAFLVWILFGLTLLPTGTAFTVTRRPTTRPSDDTTGFLWPLLLLRLIVSSVYLTSGTTKLANPDWRGGLVLWDRVVRHEHLIPVGGWIHTTLTSRLFHELLSPAAIAIELFIGIALWPRRTRLTAIWIALVFHTSIELAAAVQTFSYSAIAALLIWVTPATGDRTLTAPPTLRAVVERLDWLHRFHITPNESDTAATLIDRDGSIRRGADATLTTASRLPVLSQSSPPSSPSTDYAIASHPVTHDVSGRPGPTAEQRLFVRPLDSTGRGATRRRGERSWPGRESWRRPGRVWRQMSRVSIALQSGAPIS